MQLSLLTPNRDEAEHQAQEGMGRAEDGALRRDPKWTERSYDFLCRFAEDHPFFISEEVSEAWHEQGLPAPPTDRAWGSTYRRAKVNGIIALDGSGRSRRRHGSICPRWRSLTCRQSGDGAQSEKTEKTDVTGASAACV